LIERGWSEREGLPFEEVRNNREKDYSAIHDPSKVDELQGRLLFLKHELMISRFHAMLELACKKSTGKVELTDWRQGSELWNTVEVPKLHYERPKEGQAEGRWFEAEDTEILPHRPDAFFTLRRGEEELHFFYEADRKRTVTKRHNKKLRAHFHYIVKKRRHQEPYGVSRIRAVLIETISASWAEELRQAASHYTVSGVKVSVSLAQKVEDYALIPHNLCINGQLRLHYARFLNICAKLHQPYSGLRPQNYSSGQ
jgi:hypothetical protein